MGGVRSGPRHPLLAGAQSEWPMRMWKAGGSAWVLPRPQAELVRRLAQELGIPLMARRRAQSHRPWPTDATDGRMRRETAIPRRCGDSGPWPETTLSGTLSMIGERHGEADRKRLGRQQNVWIEQDRAVSLIGERLCEMRAERFMDLRQLRYFITIVEAGFISKAADRLRVAQPALSQHVRNMEQDLGVELLFRSPQGVKATEAGETLLRHARHILGQMDAAREEIRRGQFEPEGEVRLGMPGTVSKLLCVPLVTEARRLYPKIKLRVAEAMSGFVLDWLREGKIDVGVLYRSVSDRSFAVRPVLSEALCVLGPVTANAKPALPPGGPLSFAQVTELPLILPSASLRPAGPHRGTRARPGGACGPGDRS